MLDSTLTDMFSTQTAGVLHALVTGTGAVSMLLSDQGECVVASSGAHEALGQDGSVVGRAFEDVMPAGVAREYGELMNKSISDGRPLVAFGVLDGRWTRTSFHPLHAGEETYVLAVICAVTEHSQNTALSQRTGVYRTQTDDLGVLEDLTVRELEVLKLIGLGMSTSQIAQHLHRSTKTIDGHRVSLGVKLGMSNRIELARAAVRSGLTVLSDHDVQSLGRSGGGRGGNAAAASAEEAGTQGKR